jgi:hypothetical protein
MLERPEFHPLAARVSAALVGMLSPAVSSAQASATDDRGVLTQHGDLVVRPRGSHVAVTCTMRVENHTRSAVRLGWTLPQPPLASAHAVRVCLGERAASGEVYPSDAAGWDARRAWHDGRAAAVLWQAGPVACGLAAGWLLAGRTIELTSHHLFPRVAVGAVSSLRVHLSLAIPAAPRRGPLRPIATARARRPLQTAGTSNHAAGSPSVRLGVVARMGRYLDRGTLCQAGNSALLRGTMNGTAVRMLIVEPAEEGPESPAAYGVLEQLLSAYRGRHRAHERARLAREIAELGLRHGMVTPWTALLATRGLSGSDAVPMPADVATA